MARSRPRRDPRRGLMRAAVTAVVLVLLLFGAIEIVSSLDATTVKAPAPIPQLVPTPGPLKTATPKRASTTATARPGAKTTATTGSKKSPTAAAKASSTPKAEVKPTVKATAQNEQSPSSLLRQMARADRTSNATRHGALTAVFAPSGVTGASVMLSLVRKGRTPVAIGRANPFVRPVWSGDGNDLLYVRSQPTSAFPGIRWTLFHYRVASGVSTPLISDNALNMQPLGWLRGRALVSLSTQSDTSIATTGRGTITHLSVVMPQLLTSIRLSPDERFLAFVAPANCISTCTLDLFDLSTLRAWIGPTGVANPSTFAWTTGGSAVAFIQGGRIGLIDATSHQTAYYSLPRHLPQQWNHPFRASVQGHSVRLTDTITGATYWTRREIKT